MGPHAQQTCWSVLMSGNGGLARLVQHRRETGGGGAGEGGGEVGQVRGGTTLPTNLVIQNNKPSYPFCMVVLK